MVSFGFRFDTLFGNDWEFTKDFGLFDNAFLPNSFRGLDFPQIFGEVHLPVLTPKGIEVKGGRWYSPAGFEAVQAIYRPGLSVPNLLNFTPFTFFGVLTTLHPTERLEVYAGSVNGPDRWINLNLVWNTIGGFKWTSKDEKTTITDIFTIGPAQLPFFLRANATFVPTGFTPPPFMAGKRNAGYTHNDRYYNSFTLTHKWTDKLSEAVQVDFIIDQKTPNFGPNGTAQNTSWYGAAHWFLYDFTDKVLGFWRSEIFEDNNGAALGVADTYYEMTVGCRYKHKPWFWIRPEARYDWAQFHHPYNDGSRQGQLTLAFDVILQW
jgi:hypothetical protein